ncbi:MAG TPA: hypothetical protein VKB93_05565 [Thermoanaerobaculia bacterium]|nr:hypothetical protein [Thermoanaerobaculia bacterium]
MKRISTFTFISLDGFSLFQDVRKTNLKLAGAKSFRNGLAMHTYQPA